MVFLPAGGFQAISECVKTGVLKDLQEAHRRECPQSGSGSIRTVIAQEAPDEAPVQFITEVLAIEQEIVTDLKKLLQEVEA